MYQTMRKRSYNYLLLLLINLLMLSAFTFSDSLLRYLDVPPQTDKGSHPDLHDYDVKFYWINLEVSDTTTILKGNTLIKIQLEKDDVDTLLFELKNELSISSVKVNDEQASFTHADDYIRIPVSASKKGEYVEVNIYYEGYGGSSGFFAGMRSGYDRFYQTNVTWTLSEPYKAKQWFPCKQVLGDKADSAYIFITVEDRLMAGSNGLLTAITDIPGNKKRYEWKTYYPTAYYLLSICVAEYDEYLVYAKPEGYEDSILIQNFIYKNDFLKNYKEDIDATADMIELFSKLFGMYPFAEEKYGHCMAPMGGGMEHQTMTTLQSMDFELVAHELAHQWFGDNVTCGTWMDIWINEGFASYSEYLALEYLKGKEAADNWIGEAMMTASYAMGSVYVPEEDTDEEFRIFSYPLSYRKGALILHMIRYELNDDDLFFKLLQTFQTRFAISVATGEDFKLQLQEISGMDFTDFFNQWYYGEGYPILNVEWEQSNDTVYITTIQTAKSSSTPLFKMNVDYQFKSAEGDTTIRLFHDENEEHYEIVISKNINSIDIDPDNWLLVLVEDISNLGIVPIQHTDIEISPNPFNDKIDIEFNVSIQGEKEITLTNVSGESFYYSATDETTHSIDTKDIKPGFYLLNIRVGNREYKKKLMKE